MPFDSPVNSAHFAPSRAQNALQGLTCTSLCWFLLRDLGILDLVPLWRGAMATVFGAAILGAGLGTTRARWICVWGALGSLILWLVVAFTPLSQRIMSPLIDEQAPVRADAVVVLLASIQSDDDFGTPSLERTLHGLGLLQQGYAPRLVLTQAALPNGSHRAAATKLMRDLRLEGELRVVGPVVNTRDEALAVAQLARSQGWKKILLVTSKVHSRRAALVFAKTGLQVVSTPCRETSYNIEALRSSGERIKAFHGAIHEVVGLRAYRARGWI